MKQKIMSAAKLIANPQAPMAARTDDGAAAHLTVWGLTGGIASGKSLAARYFAEAGIPVLDADALSRELSAPGGAAHGKILARFGTADRAKLRTLVFQDTSARRDLEAILHPLIQKESLLRLKALAAPIVLYEAALLVETGRYRDLAGLLVIDAPRDLRRARLLQRDGCTPELADQILAAQMSDEERSQAATAVISNCGTPEELRAAIHRFIKQKPWG
jgi:dephospho-CoA kinase